MLTALLADETSTSSSSNIITYVFLGVIVVALIAMMIVSSRRNKKRQKEAEDLINAVRPGNKVKTIGGICGIVVEVDDTENTFVLETGSETTGKYFIKFDKQAIYQTDAVVTPAAENAENGETPEGESADKPAEEKANDASDIFEEIAAEQNAEQKTEEDK